jgi:Fe-S cluster biogenesis protein NfuA
MKNYSFEIQETPRPNILKFVANDFLVNRQSFEFGNIEEAKPSPLAQKLFYLPFVKKVYISQNFVAIEKYNIVEWPEVQVEVLETIQNFVNNGGLVMAEEALQQKKNPITVYAESTPNPSVQKFVANKKLVLSSVEFKSIDDAKASKLAQELFHFPFVKEVFMDSNYISIHKYDMVEWEDITLELREHIRQFLENNEQVVDPSLIEKKKSTATTADAKSSVENNLDLEGLDDVSQQIVAILDEYVKPAVASDGGNIVFESYDETTKEVKVILQGACSGCPSSTMTLKSGIETMLKDMLHGKVSSVVAING